MLFRRKNNKRQEEIPLLMRSVYCKCIECSKIFGNGYFNDGINEPIVGECVGKLKGVKLSIEKGS